MTNLYSGIAILIFVLLIYAVSSILIKKIPLKKQDAQNSDMEKIKIALNSGAENSELIHIDSGTSNNSEMFSSISLIALKCAEETSRQTVLMDESLLVTTNSGALAAVQEDSVKESYKKASLENEFDRNQIAFNGYSDASHQINMINETEVPAAAHINIGSFGPETVIQDLAFDGSESIFISGDNLTSQSAGIVFADGTIIGERTYELPQALSNRKGPAAELLAMDIFRWVMIGAIIAGAVMGIAGIF